MWCMRLPTHKVKCTPTVSNPAGRGFRLAREKNRLQIMWLEVGTAFEVLANMAYFPGSPIILLQISGPLVCSIYCHALMVLYFLMAKNEFKWALPLSESVENYVSMRVFVCLSGWCNLRKYGSGQNFAVLIFDPMHCFRPVLTLKRGQATKLNRILLSDG